MVTIATGPTPSRPNPFASLGKLGGVMFGRQLAQKQANEQAQREAEALAMLFGGAGAGTGADRDVRPGGTPDTGSNPFAAAIPAVSSQGDRTLSRRGPTAGADTGATPGGSAPPAAVGAGRESAPDPDEEALSHAPGGFGEMFRRMGPEQRAQAIMALRQAGVSVPEIMEMFETQPREFGFQNVGGRLVRTDPRTGRAEVVLEELQTDPETPARVRELQAAGLEPGTDEFREALLRSRGALPDEQSAAPQTALAKLRQDLNNGLINRDEFTRKREQILASDEPVVEVQDPNDPNRTIFVPRSQAAGMTASSRGQDQFTTLSPEEVQQAGFPEGTIVQRDAKGALHVRHKPSTDRDQRAQEIDALTRDLEGRVENPRQTATKIVDGTMSIEVLETGDVRLVDTAAAAAGDQGAVRALPIQFPETEPRADVPQGQTLFAQAEDATGVRSGALAVTGRIPGTDPSQQEQEVISARRTFETFQNDLARSLVHNPRFPQGEREAVLGAISISPSLFDTPGAMRTRLRSLDRFLRTRLEQFERDAQDQNLSTEVRQAQQANAAAMRNAIDRLGVPQAQSLLEGLDSPQAVQGLSSFDARMVVNQASDAELEALPDDVRAALAERLSNGER